MPPRRVGSRRQARQFALQALYTADLAGKSSEAVLDDLWSALLDGEGLDDAAHTPTQEEIAFSRRLVLGVETHRDDLDAKIESCSTNWRIVRMPVVDRNILRLAAFELLHCDDIPGTVAVNEAIELAKLYGAAESRAFVNGIVDRIGRRARRLPQRGGGAGGGKGMSAAHP